MARSTLSSSAWTEVATGITAAQVQNIGPGVVMIAFAGSAPAAAAEAGYVLQAGDFLPISGLTATNLYARAFSEASDIEALTA